MLMRNHTTLFIALVVGSTNIAGVTPSRAGSQEQVLHSFQEDNNGAYPQSGVVVDSKGNIYGTTSLAGADGAGTVFQLTPASGSGFTLLHTFNGTSDGANPRSSLLLKSGKLYGTTIGAGSSIFGTVFELTPDSSGWTYKVIHSFTGGADGGFPSGDLRSDAKGNFYGTTAAGGGSRNCTSGCGTVFQLNRSPGGTWTEKALYSFQGGTDGAGPSGALAMDRAGSLYGSTVQGGSNQCSAGCGTAFKLSRTSKGAWQKKTLSAFADMQLGWMPYSGLTFDRTGNLYGTTSLGGNLNCNPPNGCGTVFKLNPQGKQIVIHRFVNTDGDGMFPMAGLVLGAAGHLYGTTYYGGTYGSGTVFRLTTSGKLATVHDFTGDDGAFPEAPLFWDGAGHLYSTTFEGGTGSTGTVFVVTP
jgi:uncharacterized repeat protein (TIGR03803 family)